LLQIVREHYNSKLTRSWINALINYHLDALHIYLSLPQEDTRLIIPRAHFEEYIKIMKIYVFEKCTELVFNVEELGFADWDHCKVKQVIMPAAIRKEDVYHSVFHGYCHFYCHITLLTCISVVDNAMTPLLITVNPICLSFWNKSLREDENVIVRRRVSTYVDEKFSFFVF
jgi:hypothetical protein